MRGVLRDRRAERAARQQPPHARPTCFHAAAPASRCRMTGDMQPGECWRTRSALPSLVHTTKAAGLRHRDSCTPVRPASASSSSGRVACGAGSRPNTCHVVAIRIGAQRLGRTRAATSAAQLVHRGHHDMARRLVVELLNALAEVASPINVDAVLCCMASRNPHSSVSIDLLLTSVLARRDRAGCRARCALCSAASRAQCTCTPFARACVLEPLQVFRLGASSVCSLMARGKIAAAPPIPGCRASRGRASAAGPTAAGRASSEVLGRGQEAAGRLRLVHRPGAADRARRAAAAPPAGHAPAWRCPPRGPAACRSGARPPLIQARAGQGAAWPSG